MKRPEISLERGLVGEVGVVAEELQAAGAVRSESHLRRRAAEQPRQHLHRQRYLGRQPIQRVPSSNIPPPGTIMCTCG